MIKNKGFTLIELLGVLILLSLLALITIPSISSAIKKGEEKADKQVEENIVLSARNWAIDNKAKLPKNNNSCVVKLRTLEDNGYIDKNVTKPSTGIPLDKDDNCVLITNTGETSKKIQKYKYEYSTTCNSECN